MGAVWMLLVTGCLDDEDAADDTAAEAASAEDTATEAGETGDVGETGETGEGGWGSGCVDETPLDPGGPSQCNERCWLEEYPGYGWVLSCEVEVFDPGGALLEGVLDLTVEGGIFAEGMPYSAPIADAAGPGGACEACLDGDRLFFGIEIGEEKDSYTVTWRLTDSMGRRSNEVSASAP